MGHVHAVVFFWDQDIDILTDQLIARVAKVLFDRRIDKYNPAIPIGDDYRIGDRVYEAG
jgi:uncharacterized protein YjaG (DUF416 family)